MSCFNRQLASGNVDPTPGGPVAKAVVQPGDVLAAIDGSPLRGFVRDEAIRRMRGPIGTRVMLTVKRKNLDQPLQIAVERGEVGPWPLPRPVLKVQIQNGGLTVEAVGRERVFDFESSKPTIATPLSDTEFYVPGRYHTRIIFTTDATGKVVGATLNPGRWEQKGVRTK
jgi:membrane-associated protease RseP (regulator of RpoE activity)